MKGWGAVEILIKFRSCLHNLMVFVGNVVTGVEMIQLVGKLLKQDGILKYTKERFLK